MTTDLPKFQRRPCPGRLVVEVRARVPVDTVNVIDAVAMADGQARGRTKSREEKVVEILGDYARLKLREASLIRALCDDTPQRADNER